MQCDYFDAGVCRSCTLMGQPYEDQVLDKEIRTRELLQAASERSGGIDWLPAIRSPESGYRNRAKMVVAGSAEHPSVGILDHRGRGVDLRHCGICTPGIRRALPVLADFVTTVGLIPYDVPNRRGELKFVLVTEAPDGSLMVRFVLRSEGQVPRLRAHLPTLVAALPTAVVVTANLLPEHKAVTEGEREIVLTDRSTLSMRLGGIDLHLRPQSFFQTNTVVAEQLYAQATDWIDEVDPATMWDLYCGVGGFALHAARSATTAGRRRGVVGIETSREAIQSARQSAREAGLDGIRFAADDATAHALRTGPGDVPELVVVNPPRRGIGSALAGWLESSGVQHVVYSSCNPVTLAKDLAAMPSLRVRRARVLDMFPQTEHLEVVALLTRA